MHGATSILDGLVTQYNAKKAICKCFGTQHIGYECYQSECFHTKAELGDNGEMFLQAGKWEACSCLSKLGICIVSDKPPTIHTMAGRGHPWNTLGRLSCNPPEKKVIQVWLAGCRHCPAFWHFLWIKLRNFWNFSSWKIWSENSFRRHYKSFLFSDWIH